MIAQRQMQMLGREGGFQIEQGILLVAAQDYPEVLQRRQGRRKEQGRGAALEGGADLPGGIQAEQPQARVPADFFHIGDIVVVEQLGNAQKSHRLEVKFAQLPLVGRGHIAAQDGLGRSDEIPQLGQQIVGQLGARPGLAIALVAAEPAVVQQGGIEFIEAATEGGVILFYHAL